jgi:hypothetical protein
MAVDTYKEEVRVKAVLAACSSDTRRVARMWLYYTLFYWMFPTLAVLFTYLLANQPVKLLDLVIHGEFLIYAITIVAGSTRLIAKDIPSRGPFVSRQGFNLVSHIMIFPAIVAYVLLRYIGAVSANPYTVNTKLVVVYSIVLLIGAFTFSYVVFLIDAQRSTPEELPKRVAAQIAQTPDKLKAEFDTIQKDDVSTKPTTAGPVIEEAEEIVGAAEEQEEQEAPLPASSEPNALSDEPLTDQEEEEQ